MTAGDPWFDHEKEQDDKNDKEDEHPPRLGDGSDKEQTKRRDCDKGIDYKRRDHGLFSVEFAIQRLAIFTRITS
jgi:hypothetical protein